MSETQCKINEARITLTLCDIVWGVQRLGRLLCVHETDSSVRSRVICCDEDCLLPYEAHAQSRHQHSEHASQVLCLDQPLCERSSSKSSDRKEQEERKADQDIKKVESLIDWTVVLYCYEKGDSALRRSCTTHIHTLSEDSVHVMYNSMLRDFQYASSVKLQTAMGVPKCE